MAELEIKCLTVSSCYTNCYVCCNKDTKEGFIVDPGDDFVKITNYINSMDMKVVAIILTHGHFDHIGAVDEIRNRYGIKVYAAAAEKETLENPDINLSSQFGSGYTVKADEFLNDGQEIELLGEKVRCLLTPGHTKGGMCYYFTGSGILFSGDTLFQQSVGRTDFPGGSMGEIVRSIREKLFVLPDYVRVYTGHGMMTNIKDEKMLNPFAVE